MFGVSGFRVEQAFMPAFKFYKFPASAAEVRTLTDTLAANRATTFV